MLRHAIALPIPIPTRQGQGEASGMLRYGNEPMALWGTARAAASRSGLPRKIGFAIPRQFKNIRQ